MRSNSLNPEEDRAGQRIKIAVDTDTARRLRNFADRAAVSLSDAGRHFIALGMERQAAINSAKRFAAELHNANEADISYEPEAEGEAGDGDAAGERETWER
jgi:hypothetical protein